MRPISEAINYLEQRRNTNGDISIDLRAGYKSSITIDGEEYHLPKWLATSIQRYADSQKYPQTQPYFTFPQQGTLGIPTPQDTYPTIWYSTANNPNEMVNIGS